VCNTCTEHCCIVQSSIITQSQRRYANGFTLGEPKALVIKYICFCWSDYSVHTQNTDTLLVFCSPFQNNIPDVILATNIVGRHIIRLSWSYLKVMVKTIRTIRAHFRRLARPYLSCVTGYPIPNTTLLFWHSASKIIQTIWMYIEFVRLMYWFIRKYHKHTKPLATHDCYIVDRYGTL